MNPHLQATLDCYDELFDQLVGFLPPLDEEVLNWRPPADDSNTIAGLVHHLCGSTNVWLARSVGEQIERNRDAEFRGQGAAAALVAMIEQTRGEVRRRIRLLDGRDLSGTIDVQRMGGAHAGTRMSVSLAWCVEHALVHAGEHWGHVQLTQQLFARRG